MAFVYRYLDSAGRRKYYGLVNGDDIRSLATRLWQHSKEPSFKPSWKIEFVDGLTRTDADILESHYINSDGKNLINSAKVGKGEITIVDVPELEWKPYKFDPRTTRINEHSKEYADYLASAPSQRFAPTVANQVLDLRQKLSDLEKDTEEKMSWWNDTQRTLDDLEDALAEEILYAISLEDALDDLLEQLAYHHIKFGWHNWKDEKEEAR